MRILLIEDKAGDVRLLKEHLLRDGSSRVDEFQLLHVDRLAAGLERLADAPVGCRVAGSFASR